jgi:hypothetical protein
MNGLRTRKNLHHASLHDLADRAARADAIIAAACCVGLVVLLILQLAEKVSA